MLLFCAEAKHTTPFLIAHHAFICWYRFRLNLSYTLCTSCSYNYIYSEVDCVSPYPCSQTTCKDHCNNSKGMLFERAHIHNERGIINNEGRKLGCEYYHRSFAKEVEDPQLNSNQYSVVHSKTLHSTMSSHLCMTHTPSSQLEYITQYFIVHVKSIRHKYETCHAILTSCYIAKAQGTIHKRGSSKAQPSWRLLAYNWGQSMFCMHLPALVITACTCLKSTSSTSCSHPQVGFLQYLYYNRYMT